MKYGALSALLIASINMQAAQEGTTRYTILPKARSSTSSTSVPAMHGVCSFSVYGQRNSRSRLPTGSSLPRMMP